MGRTLGLAAAAALVVACSSADDKGGPAPTGTDGGGAPETGSAGDDGGTTTNDGAVSAGDASNDAPPPQVDAAPDAPTSCVKETVVLATSATDPTCGFPYTLPAGYTQDQVNIILTPGAGTVCFGYGCGAQGGWFWQNNGIALCDTTCAKYAREPAGKLTVELGCPTVACP